MRKIRFYLIALLVCFTLTSTALYSVSYAQTGESIATISGPLMGSKSKNPFAAVIGLILAPIEAALKWFTNDLLAPLLKESFKLVIFPAISGLLSVLEGFFTDVLKPVLSGALSLLSSIMADADSLRGVLNSLDAEAGKELEKGMAKVFKDIAQDVKPMEGILKDALVLDGPADLSAHLLLSAVKLSGKKLEHAKNYVSTISGGNSGLPAPPKIVDGKVTPQMLRYKNLFNQTASTVSTSGAIFSSTLAAKTLIKGAEHSYMSAVDEICRKTDDPGIIKTIGTVLPPISMMYTTTHKVICAVIKLPRMGEDLLHTSFAMAGAFVFMLTNVFKPILMQQHHDATYSIAKDIVRAAKKKASD